MTAPLSTLTGQVINTTSWQPAAINLVGTDYNPNQNNSVITKILTLGTAAAPNAANGADIIYSAITVVSPSSTASINLNNFVDILLTTVTTMVRVKYILVRLLSTTDDPVNGTNAVSCLVGAAGGSTTNIFQGFMYNTASTFRVYNGGFTAMGVANASGVPVSGSDYILKLTNEDASNNAAVQVTFFGGDS